MPLIYITGILLITLATSFIMPSLFLSWALWNEWALPPTSVLTSERFWIYFVEIARLDTKWLMSWPGNLPDVEPNSLYLERFLPRAALQIFPKAISLSQMQSLVSLSQYCVCFS